MVSFFCISSTTVIGISYDICFMGGKYFIFASFYEIFDRNFWSYLTSSASRSHKYLSNISQKLAKHFSHRYPNGSIFEFLHKKSINHINKNLHRHLNRVFLNLNDVSLNPNASLNLLWIVLDIHSHLKQQKFQSIDRIWRAKVTCH